MEFEWVDGYEISVRSEKGVALIKANKEGLQSLAGHLLKLAEEAPGSHFHLDRHNSLEDDSDELIIEKGE